MRPFIWLTLSFIVSGVSAYFARPLLHENTNAVTIMITVITVFAGFLVAIISILGDPALIPEGSWREAEARLPGLRAALTRHSLLFYLYLAAIAFLFAGVLLQKTVSLPNTVMKLVEGVALFLTIFSFLQTLTLPRALSRTQIARSEAEIEARRGSAGFPSRS